MAWTVPEARIHLENKTSEKIPLNHEIVPWMVSWAGDVLLKYREKPNGRTAYEETTGHKVNHKVLAFGERVKFQVALNWSKTTLS